jgi:hypothetical protein
MSTDEQLIRDACEIAAAQLGVRIVTPFTLPGEGGRPVEFIALFPDFGSPKGTTVCHFRDWPAKNAAAIAQGYYCSGLHPDSYARYDREQFVDAFREWGWQGSTSGAPEWCRG